MSRSLDAIEGEFDVAVIGAGVVGCAVARELAMRGAAVALLDARDDVGDETSKANTAILHTGFDAKPSTLESRLVAKGHRLLRRYAAAAGIPVESTGALLLAWDDEQYDALPSLAEQAAVNGYERIRTVDVAELRSIEPHLGPSVRGALMVPDESIICPWTTTLAFATDAVRHGAALLLGAEVSGADPIGERWMLHTSRGWLDAGHVVNVAGLHSDTVHQMFGHDGFTVTPRRGELVVFDKLARSLVNHILLPTPIRMGKGVLVAPTVYGNVLLGPTADDIADRSLVGSTEDGLAMLRAKGGQIVPALLDEEVTTIYAGLRAATEHDDYQISFHPEQHYVCVGGIRSTGLTSSLAIAEYVADMMSDRLGLAQPGSAEDEHPDPPLMPNIGETGTRAYADARRIAADPQYGEVVCFCERVTRGEIRDALVSEIRPATVEGLRRRTRVGMGRCQGFFCGATVRQMLADGVDSPGTPDPVTVRAT